MRREFIIVLLAIITVSTISSFLDGCTRPAPEPVLLDRVLGAVGAGNFSYWQLRHAGPLLVELVSLSGDADLYVADNISPSYEADRNNFSSVTCGRDQVLIPASFPRPIGVGVFGHWSHRLSEYSIQVYHDGGAGLPGPPAAPRDPEKYDPKKHSSESIPQKDRKKPIVMRFLNIVDTVLDMFVL